MSNTNPTNNTEPAVYQAELVVPPDRTSSVKYVLLGCAGALALFVLVLGIIGWIAYKKIVTGADAAGTFSNVSVIEQESKRRMTAARFRAPQELQPSKTLKELEQAIAGIMACGDDDVKLRQRISINGFIRQMMQSGEVPNLSYLQKRSIQNQFVGVTHGPDTRRHFRIVDVSHPAADECIVYLYGWDQPNDSEQYLFWMVRESNQWKLSDWEWVSSGMSEATSYAKLVRLQSAPGISEYYRALKLMGEAYDAEVALDHATCKQKLESCDGIVVHPEFHDYINFFLGRRWMNIDVDRSKSAFSKIRNARQTPGKDFGLLFVAEQEGDDEKVIEHADAVQEIVGYSPNAAQSWVKAKARLGKFDEAKSGLLKLMARFPEDDSAVAEIFETQKEVDDKFVDEILSQVENPAALALKISYRLRGHRHVPKLNSLQRWLEGRSDGSGISSYLKGLGHDYLWEFDETVAAYQAAIAKAGEANRQDFQRALNDAFISKGLQMEAYLSATNKLECLSLLLEGDEYDEPVIGGEQLENILKAAENDFPKSHIPRYHRALLLLDRQDYEAAKQQFVMAKNKITDDDSVSESIDAGLDRIAILTGDIQKNFKDHPDSDRYFLELAQSLTKKGDMEQLGQLVEIQRAKNADDLLAHSYSALISAHQGRYQQAIEIIEKADSPDVESDATWQRNYGQQIVVSWIVKQDHWRACLAEAGSSSPVYKAFLTELDRNERNSEVRELLTRHEVLDLPLEDRFPVLIEQLRNSQNDAEMIRVCKLMHSLALKQLPNYEATRIYMAWLRACIRSNDLVEANRIADLLYADHDNECGKLFLSVVQRDFRKASELVPQLDNARWSMREFFWCEEMRPLREDPAFHDLNKKLAPYLEDHFGQHFTSILTKTPVNMTLEKVQRTLEPTGQVTESASQLNGADFNFDGDIFLFSLGDQKGMISASTTRWSPSESAELSTSERQVIETAKGELTVTLFDPERLADSSRVSYELARELSHENATCAYAYPNMLLLCPTSESAIRTLPGFDEFTKLARIEYLDLNTNLPQPGDYGTQEYWSRSHRNQQLIVAVESGKAPNKFQVKVMQKFQKFSEKLWMDVLGVDDLDTEYPMLICRLFEDSKISPYLSKNTIWSVSLSEVIEWRERE